MYAIPSYLSVLKLQNYYSECSSCAFFREIEEKLFWVIEAINKARLTSYIMNLSHTLCVVADSKALCSMQKHFALSSVSRGLNTQKKITKLGKVA